jgi:hypothetical protein
MILKLRGGLWIILLMTALMTLGSCYTHYTLVVGLSPDLKDYYGIYPTTEVDIAAVKSATVDQIKTAGVDSYFAPGSTSRQTINPYTIRFSEEITAPRTVKYKDTPWKQWRKNKPEVLVLIANLPLSPDAQGDNRLVTLNIKSILYQARTAYFELIPLGITQIEEDPGNPQVAQETSPAPKKPEAPQPVAEDTSPFGKWYLNLNGGQQ